MLSIRPVSIMDGSGMEFSKILTYGKSKSWFKSHILSKSYRPDYWLVKIAEAGKQIINVSVIRKKRKKFWQKNK